MGYEPTDADGRVVVVNVYRMDSAPDKLLADVCHLRREGNEVLFTILRSVVRSGQSVAEVGELAYKRFVELGAYVGGSR